MKKILCVVIIEFVLVCSSCSDGNSPNASPQTTMATHMMRTSAALERIANVLENPNCICPQATTPVEETVEVEVGPDAGVPAPGQARGVLPGDCATGNTDAADGLIDPSGE